MDKYIIDLSNINTFELFDYVLKKNDKTSLYSDLRKIYSEKIIDAFKKSGIKTFGITQHISRKLTNNSTEINPISSLYNDEPLGVVFCAGYGVSDYSLSAINYQHGIYSELPSLDTFFKRKNYSIGNFGFLVDNGDYEIEIISKGDIKIVGYSFEINQRKRKSDVAIFGVYFSYDSLKPVFEKYYHIPADTNDLIDVKLNTVNYPSFFMCRKTGKLFICDCFKDLIDWKWDFERFANIHEEEIKERVKSATFTKEICHYCTKSSPTTETPTSEYSGFLRKYASYYHLENKKRFGSIFHFKKEDNILVENELRQHFGYPKIGERWITETHLFNLIKELFPNLNPIFHYRGKEMQGLELDIFIEELKLGIEYQGEQHFEAIEHWGGKDGLIKRKQNDKRKIQLCKENEYHFVEFSYKDNINRDLVLEKIRKTLHNTVQIS